VIFVISTIAITPTSSDIDPSAFSPGDNNGLNDTTTITVEYITGRNLYANIFDDQSNLIGEDRAMTESPSGTYKYTWNGKNDSNQYVNDGIYTIRISDDPSSNGDAIGSVEVNTTAPSSPSLSIDGGATYATSTDVNLTIGATGATKMKVSNDANYTNATWENYATSKSWQVSSGDGTKTVYINFKTSAGANASTSDDITLDTTIADPSLLINGGNGFTTSRDVTLNITANGATYMKIDNDTAFSNMSNWISIASTYSFTLPSGVSNPRVYLRVRDDAGNQKTTSDNITVDDQGPTNLSISINSGASYTNSTSAMLTFSANGGPSTMYIKNSGGSWVSYNYATSLSWNLSSGDGSKTVYFNAADSGGNNGTETSATITLDTLKPSAVNLGTPSGTISNQIPQFNWTNPNNVSSTKQFYIEILQGGVIDSNYTSSSTTTYTSETLAEGSYTWRVTVYDKANNSATTSEQSFTISVGGLAIPSPTYPENSAYVNASAPYMIRLWCSPVTSGDGSTVYYDYRYGLSTDNQNNTDSATNPYAKISQSYSSHGQTVYWSVRARNNSGSTAYCSNRSFTVDTQPPTLNSISINSGDTYTSSTSVTLTLSATGASWMMVSENADFSGASWVAYSTSKSFSLSSSDGTKTVYFRAKDNAVGDEGSTTYANINTSALSDTIILDTAAPTFSNQFPTSSSVTDTTPAITVDYADLGSGINTSSVVIKVDDVDVTSSGDTTVSASSVTYEPSTALSVSIHTVNVTVSDSYGNTNYIEWTFTIVSSGDGDGDGDGDGGIIIPPISISNIDHNPKTITSSDQVNITATISATYGVHLARVYYKYDGTLHDATMTNISGNYYALIGPIHEGASVTYYIYVIDEQASSETSSNYSFTVQDTNEPTITIVSPSNNAKITERTPTIQATYSDPGGINTNSVSLTFDNNDVTSDATITSTTVTYTPPTALAYAKYSATVEVADNASNTATTNWSFIVQAEEIEMMEIIDEIAEGETKTINLTEYVSSLQTIEITAAKSLENVTINITTTSEPDGVTEPTDEVYLYIVIDIDVEASDISSVNISFEVEKIWLDHHNIDKSTVRLLRYNNGEWEELTTTIVTEDDDYVYYKATTPGFSTFAIVGTPTSTTPTIEIPSYIIIILVVVIIIAVIALLFKTGYIYIEKKPDGPKKQQKIKKKK